MTDYDEITDCYDDVEIELFGKKGYEIRTEMISGKKKFVLEIDPLELHPFERKFLGAQVCSYMLPMNFLRADETELVYYDFTNRISLKNYILACCKRRSGRLPMGEDLQLAFSLLADILKAVRGAEDCLLFLERYYFDGEVIFIQPNTKEVSIAYLPERNVFSSVERKIMNCIDYMGDVFQDAEVKTAMFQLKEFAASHNMGIEGMIKEVGKRRRKLASAYEA